MGIMSDTVCKKVIFIIGAGHSGTTLLGMMLGTHPDALFAGEMQESQFLDDETRPVYKRTCRACGTGCPIWNTKTNTKEEIYESVARASGRSIIIDSTKKPLDWVREHAQKLSVSKSLILLTRDPRAVVASNKRKFHQKTIQEHAQEWATQIQKCESLIQYFPGRVARVRYEELATKPRETLQAVCETIELPFNEHMLYPWDSNHHPLRGNMGTQSIAHGNVRALTQVRQTYYENHPKSIVLDERWKTELSASDEEKIKEAAGLLFSVYTWQA